MREVLYFEKEKLAIKYLLLAFFIPFVIMTISYALIDIFPFGNRDILTVDLYHQYAPFLGALREKVLNGGSLLYAWDGGLGTNFYALFAYYLASPLNILLLLFPLSYLTEAVLFLTVLKISLASVTCYLFLRYTYEQNNWLHVAMSILYALSSYVLSYSWNIMWLDGIYLLPLVMLGLVFLVRDQRYKLYVLALALTIISNYYIAYFICLFSVLYFMVLLVRYGEKEHCREYIKTCLKFLIASIFAGGLAAFIALPTWKALSLTSASGDIFPKDLTSYYTPFSYLKQHLLLTEPTSRDGMANLYCGMIVLFLIPLFFLAKKISWKEKLSHLILIIFMLLSFNINILNYIWHGMHFPNQLPFRNSFLYIFLLISMLPLAFKAIKEFTYKQLALLGMMLCFLIMVVQQLSDNEYTIESSYLALIFVVIYGLFMLFLKRRRLKTKDYSIILLIIIISELFINTTVTMQRIDKKEYYSTRDDYLTGQKVKDIRDAQAFIQEFDKDLFYRSEIRTTKTVNDPFLYGLNGLTIFASTSSKKPVTLFSRLGYANNGVNSYKYDGSTAVLDAIFNVRYLYKRDESNLVENTRSEVYHNENIKVYQANETFSIGFMGTTGLKDWQAENFGDPFNIQNSLVHALGYDKDVLFRRSIGESQEDSNGYTTKEDEKYNFTRTNLATESRFKMKIEHDQDETLYLHFNSNGSKPVNAYIRVDDEIINFRSFDKTLVELGFIEADVNPEIEIVYNEKAPASGSFDVHAFALDEAAYKEFAEQIKKEEITLTHFSDRALAGNIKALKDGVVFTSMIYDPGWVVKVDGEVVPHFPISNALIGFEVSAGEHEISFKFTPPLLKTGIFISLISLICFVLISLWERKMRKLKRGKNDPPNMIGKIYSPDTEQQNEIYDKITNYVDEGEQ